MNDRDIAAWIRKAEVLSERLGVPPSEVYEALIERGYSTKRSTVPRQEAVAFVAALFRPEEILPVPEVTRRFTQDPKRVVQTKDPQGYIKALLSRNADERGLRRFRRVGHGAYRLQLSNAELRVALMQELSTQRTFVGSRRLMEMFDVSHDRLLEVLGPLVSRGSVVSRPNTTTQSRDWCLQRYAEVFSR